MLANHQHISALELFGRGVVAVVASSLMTAGLYPFGPAIVAARARRQSVLARLLRADLALEWTLSVGAALARPVGFAYLPGARVRGARPVILTHGFAMGRSCFLPLAARLAADGIGPITSFEYWSFGSISESARRLGRLVERVLDATGASEVDIVAHSMGGVISRYYLNLEGGGAHVRQLITLGSPHRGTEMGPFGVGPIRLELAPGSPTLTRLAASSTPAGSQLTVIYSPIDVLVGGSRHAAIEGAEVIRFDDVGHMAMLINRRVYDVIAARLGRA